jgi:hypothetical protein
MSRPLRIEFPEAIYHVTARGDRREPIFDNDQDRAEFLDLVGKTLDRFDACVIGLLPDGQPLPSGPAYPQRHTTPGSGLALTHCITCT